MFSSSIRRLSIGVVSVVIGSALMLVGSGPASANQCHLDSSMYFSGGYLDAFLQNECINPEYVTPLNLSIEKYNPSSGTWSVVATGHGTARYVCTCTDPTTYRSTNEAPATYNCG